MLIISMVLLTIPSQAFAADNDAPSAASNYSDVKGTWSEQWVNKYGYSELFSNADGNFRPNQAITRMEFARLLHKALGININYFAATDINEYFSDVKNSDAGAGALYDLVTCGIVDTKTSFRPNEALKRDEMIHYIMNAVNYYTGDNYAYIEIYHIFEDDSIIKPEYSTDVQHAHILGLIKGRNSNYLSPLETATRAEAVTIVGRLAELTGELTSSVAVKASATQENGGLKLRLTISNNSDKAVTINHSSQQLFDFAIYDNKGETLYFWSASRMFAAVVTTTKIESGKELVFEDTVSAADYSLIKDKISTVKGFITGSSPDFTVNHEGYLVTNIVKCE